MRITLLAALCGAAFSTSLQAETEYTLDEVVITATRFAEADPAIPANISVITRQDIRSTPAMNLPDLLRTRAGVNVASLYGQMATHASVGLRGFGDSGTANTLILLDGQRLNPIDSGGILWSAIPLDSILRIEIVRGSGSVLYGDRASGGVINIVTDKTAKPAASAAATLGSYGYKSVDADAAGRAGETGYRLNGHLADTDGWRDNSQAEEASITGRVGTRLASLDAFLDFTAFRDASGTPGALFTAQYDAQPDMARYPYDKQKHDGLRLRPGIAVKLADHLEFEGELGYLDDRYRGYSYTAAGVPTYTSDRAGKTLSATPRLRWSHQLGGQASESVLGLDHYDGEIDNDTWSSFSGANNQAASQVSTALYLQNTTALNDRLDLTAGVRSQRMKQAASDRSAGMSSEATRTRNAWELGLSHRLDDNARVYARVGRSFRFPTTDELFGFDPFTYETIFRGDLKPQQGDTREIGAAWKSAQFALDASLFQTDLSDEIGFDGATFSNINLPDTRHQGIELEGRWQISPTWRARLAHAATSATFRAGAYDGNDIPSVPHQKSTLELAWNGGQAGVWSALVNHVGSQRYSGDEANTLNTRPGYTTVDLRADWTLRDWRLTARVSNLFDRDYATAAGYSSAWGDYYYYPADPRSLFVGARYTFR
jgi:iron complex outermembrane receptor protein